MPSAFRSSRSGRQLDSSSRSRGQTDHDVFEGLPVRRWSRQVQTVSQAPKTEESEFSVQGPGGSAVLPELAMPRDSHLLPAASKALLRAARAGCIYVRPSGRNTKEEEQNMMKAEEKANANNHMAERTFSSRKWAMHAKHSEPPEVEFLAKRRPGLPSLYGGPVSADGASGVAAAPMRRTKFQKVDAATGNISIYEAWVPEGHRIEGEVTGDIQAIVEQSEVPVKPEAPAPGTLVEGVGIVDSEGVVVAETSSAAVVNPNKRRPPPPKRKGKGVGKGRKKKVMFAPGEGADAATVHGVNPSAEGGADGPKLGQDGQSIPVDQSGQDDDEDDGEDGDESDEGDESMVDAKTPETPLPQSFDESTEQQPTDTPVDQEKDIEMKDALPEPVPSVSEPVSTDSLPQVSAIPEDKAVEQEAEVSASAIPAPPAEPTQEPAVETNESTEPPKEISPPREPLADASESDANAKQAEDEAPKEEPLDAPSTSLPGVEDAKQSPSTEQQETVNTTAEETQVVSEPVKPEDSTPAPVSATPDEKPSTSTPPKELPAPTEPENIAEETTLPPADNHPIEHEQPEATPAAHEEAKDQTSAGASPNKVEEEQDTVMTDAADPEPQQTVSEEPPAPSEKPASPTPPQLPTETQSTVDSTPETTEAPAAEPSAPEQSTSVPEPTEPEAKPEDKPEEPSVPTPAPAPAPAPAEGAAEDKIDAAQEAEPKTEPEPESETKKEESDSNPVPAPNATA